MFDALDKTLWAALIGGTATLYGINWFISRRKYTVYRISEESLAKSKQVVLRVLPLVEDGQDSPLDETLLPFAKKDVKSAAKILGYFYLKQRKEIDFNRVKECFVSLARFQEKELEEEKKLKIVAKEKTKLRLEFDAYVRNTHITCEPCNKDVVQKNGTMD